MKSKFQLFASLCALFVLVIQPHSRLLAQDSTALTQTVKGTVINLDDQQPVAGARIHVLGTRLGAISKSDGSFRIERVPVGRHEIEVALYGYETSGQDILVTSGKQVVLDLRIRSKVVQGAEITVTSGAESFSPINEDALVSATTFTVDEVKRFAGSREDPARMAQTFAGIVGADDQRNDIIIRGGSPLELLWRLDGIDIPNPNHFATQGATGGPVNAINVNLLSNSDFLTGAFPAEYGNKISGVFDLRTRKGNSERYEFVAQMGFAGFEGMAEGPLFTPGSSFIVSYRKSTLEIFHALGIDFGFAGVPKYDDLTIKADVPLGASDALSIIGLGGRSNIDINQSTQDTVLTGDFDISNGSDLGVLGATWKHIFNDHTIGTFAASTVYQTYSTVVDSLTASSDYKLTGKDLFYTDNSKEGANSLKYTLNYSANTSHDFSAGIEGRLPFYDLNEARTTTRNPGPVFTLNQSGTSQEVLSFINWQWRPSNDLTFNTGLHYHYLAISGQSSFEPRFGARWSFADNQSLNAGFGVHRQAQPLVVYFGNDANRSLDFTQSIHYILGYTNHFASDLLFKAEGYYKDISHAPVDRDSATSFSYLNAGANFGGVSTDKALASNGLGRSYGLELTLMKHFSDGYYFTATTSLFRQQFTGSDGVWRDGAFDNEYIINLLGGYEWKLSPTFSIEFSSKFTLAGGAPYTLVDTVRARQFNSSGEFGPQYFEDSKAFSERYPVYERLDVKVEFRQNLGSVSIVGFFTAENALNHKNILIYSYDPRTHSITHINQLGLFPYGGFRVEF